jgi:HEAT repeats/HEAT repeat associated with sister chromatid cohesion
MCPRWLIAAMSSAVLWAAPQFACADDGPRGCVPDDLTGLFRDSFQNQPQTYRALLVQAFAAEEDTLRTALTSKSSSERLAAAYVIGERLLPWTGELIERLTDSSPLVRQAARRSLIILSYFTLLDENMDKAMAGERMTGRRVIADFGPKPGADRTAQDKAAKNWEEWWTKHGNGKQTKVQAVRSQGEVDVAAARLSAALVFAPPERQTEEVARYRDGKGIVYTEAMADALPQLDAAMQRKVREALAERLARMTAATLRDRLTDSRSEMRRAAVLALATKGDRSSVPDLIPSLADEEENVVRAAKAALKSLADQDFGPPRNSTASERAAAVAAWKSWWRKQQ